jgi:hypothetical protein
MKIKIISLLCLSFCFGPGSESPQVPECGQFYKTVDGKRIVVVNPGNIILDEYNHPLVIVQGYLRGFKSLSSGDTTRFLEILDTYDPSTDGTQGNIYGLTIDKIRAFVKGIDTCSFSVYVQSLNMRIEWKLIKLNDAHDSAELLQKILNELNNHLFFSIGVGRAYEKDFIDEDRSKLLCINQDWFNQNLGAQASWSIEEPIIHPGVGTDEYLQREFQGAILDDSEDRPVVSEVAEGFI